MIGLVGVILMLVLFYGPFYDMIKKSFCYFYEQIFHQTTDFCPKKEKNCMAVEINPYTEEELARDVAQYAIQAWMGYEGITCYDLVLQNHPGKVYEENVTKIMETESNGCDILQNSKVVDANGNLVPYAGDCGTDDKINWQADNYVISDQVDIYIKHNVDTKKIIIK